MVHREADDHAIPAMSRADPYPYFRQLRATDPVHHSSTTDTWFISRHADCIAVLRDDCFSASLGQSMRRRADGLPPSMLSSDPPDHERLRRPAAALFTRDRLARVRSRLDVAVDLLLTHGRQRGEFDGIADFAEPVAMLTLTTVLGVLDTDVPAFADLARRAAVNIDPLAEVAPGSPGVAAAADLARHMRDALRPDRHAGHGAIAELSRELQRGSIDLDAEEVVAMLCLMVIGGYDPLISVVGNSLHTLLTDMSTRQRLRSDMALVPRAIDEFMRWESPIPFTARVCRQATVAGGREIPRGALVVALLAAANRDPDVFPDPERLDVGRLTNPMIAFGSGIHRCVAAPLVREVATCAIGRFVQAAPAAVVVGAEPRWRAARVPRALAQLPIRLAGHVDSGRDD